MIVIPSKMGRLNQRALLSGLQRAGVASRADLAKALGLSQPTAGKIVDELLTMGVIEEVESPARSEAGAPVKLGRPGRLLRLNQSTPRFLAVQLGVTETRLAALPVGVTPDDRWAGRFKTPTSAAAWIKSLAAAGRSFRFPSLWGVLVSVPGIVDELAGDVVYSPNLHWTEKCGLAHMIEETLGLPALLVQEERALALGQQYVEPKNRDFMLADFGEGVGGAIVVEGRIFAPPLPISGEFGHTPVPGNTRSCGCGARGCLETLISRRGLLQSLAEQHPGSNVNWMGLVHRLVEEGMPPWLLDTLNAAAAVLAGALNVLGLRKIVVTGSLTELPKEALDHLRKSIVQGCLWARFGEVEVVGAPRRRMAGLVASGIDRLVLPVTRSLERDHAAMPLASRSPLFKSIQAPE